MSHKENFANCEVAGHNPRIFDDHQCICLYCGKMIKNTDLTDREVKIVDYYNNHVSQDRWAYDYTTNDSGKDIRVSDKMDY